MDWLSLESSVFTAALYCPDQCLLYLRFRSGAVYRYFDLAPDEYEAFLTAESKGEYFAHHIRDKYRYERM